MIFKVIEVTKVKFSFWSINQNAIKLFCLVSGKMPIHFGVAIFNSSVTECKKVENHMWYYNFVTIRAIKLQLGTVTHLKTTNLQ